MVFLNPAILFGLLAASIPILIHLLNLRKLKKIEFSTLQFLKELQKQKIRRIKIKQWLLLALRVMIILFLVTAFARPTLEGVALGGTTSAAKTTAVFIFDDTFSMSVIDARGSYFNQAKEIMLDLLKNFQEGDEIAVINISGNNPEELKPTTNLSEIINSIQEISISNVSGSIHNSLIKAARIISESKNFNKEIYILTDFQQGRITDESAASDLGELLDQNIKLYTVQVSGGDVFNAAITNIKVRSQIFEKNKPISFEVTVTNFAATPALNVVVSLFMDDERKVQQSVDIGAGQSQVLSMETIADRTGFIKIYAEIEDDAILHDNRRYTNIFIPDQIPVLILSDNEADAAFLNLALTAADNDKTLNITSRNLSQIASVDLIRFKTVFVIGSGSGKRLERLNSFVNSGGGLVLMPGSGTTLDGYQALTSALNLPQPSASIGRINDASNIFNFDNVEFGHPLFSELFVKKEKRNVESPDIYHYFRISTAGLGRNIITMNDGSSFLGEYLNGSGKRLLFNLAPVLGWSNFPLKSIFAPLLHKSVFYLSAADRRADDHIAGSRVNLNLRGNVSPQLRIEQPEDSEEIINRTGDISNFIDFENTSHVGNYKVFAGDELIEMFAVNTDPLESTVSYVTRSEFEEYLDKINFKGKHIAIDRDMNPAEVILQARFGSELWKYFLVVALLLALIEMLIARNVKKELAEVN